MSIALIKNKRWRPKTDMILEESSSTRVPCLRQLLNFSPYLNQMVNGHN